VEDEDVDVEQALSKVDLGTQGTTP
jgi:hypothetical protein